MIEFIFIAAVLAALMFIIRYFIAWSFRIDEVINELKKLNNRLD